MSDEVREPVIEDVDLERVLDEMEDDFDQVEAFGRWMPPVGPYTVSVTRAQPGTFNSKQLGGKECSYCAVYGTIQAGQLEGREFQLGYFSLDTSIRKSISKGAANTIAGRETESWKDVIAVLKGSLGTVLEVKVTEKEKDGRKYKNVLIQNRID